MTFQLVGGIFDGRVVQLPMCASFGLIEAAVLGFSDGSCGHYWYGPEGVPIPVDVLYVYRRGFGGVFYFQDRLSGLRDLISLASV
jgi:hypothetical protein